MDNSHFLNLNFREVLTNTKILYTVQFHNIEASRLQKMESSSDNKNLEKVLDNDSIDWQTWTFQMVYAKKSFLLKNSIHWNTLTAIENKMEIPMLSLILSAFNVQDFHNINIISFKSLIFLYHLMILDRRKSFLWRRTEIRATPND